MDPLRCPNSKEQKAPNPPAYTREELGHGGAQRQNGPARPSPWLRIPRAAGFCGPLALLGLARRPQEFACHVQMQEKGRLWLVSLGVREPVHLHPPPPFRSQLARICHVFMPQPISSKEMGQPRLAEVPGAGAASPEHRAIHRSRELEPSGFCEEGMGEVVAA